MKVAFIALFFVCSSWAMAADDQQFTEELFKAITGATTQSQKTEEGFQLNPEIDWYKLIISEEDVDCEKNHFTALVQNNAEALFNEATNKWEVVFIGGRSSAEKQNLPQVTLQAADKRVCLALKQSLSKIDSGNCVKEGRMEAQLEGSKLLQIRNMERNNPGIECL